MVAWETWVILDKANRYILVAFNVMYMLANGFQVDLKQMTLRRNLRPPLLAIFTQLVLNPLVLFGIITAFQPKDMVKLVAVLIAVAPAGNVSQMVTQIGGGTLEISVMCTTLTVLMSIFTFPAWVKLAEHIFDFEGAELSFGAIIAGILCVILPLSIGIAVQYFGKVTKDNSKRLRGVIVFCVSSSAFLGFAALSLQLANPIGRDRLFYGLTANPTCFVCMIIVSGLVGYAVSWAARFPTIFHRTMMFEIGIQNTAMVTAVGSVALEQDVFSTVLGLTVAYTWCQLIVFFPIAGGFRVADRLMKSRTAGAKDQARDMEAGASGQLAEAQRVESAATDPDSCVAEGDSNGQEAYTEADKSAETITPQCSEGGPHISSDVCV